MPKKFKERQHYVAPFLFHLVAAQKCRLFAHKGKNKPGRAVAWNDPDTTKHVAGPDEYEIGVYNGNVEGKEGIYSISYQHKCITDHEKNELRTVNVKKPIIFNPARLKHKDLNKLKAITRAAARAAAAAAQNPPPYGELPPYSRLARK